MTAPVNTATPQGNPPPNGLQNKNLGQNDFLKLMVAQVKNQDPLSPQANGEFLSQLAQFSATDGINNIQQSVQQLVGSLESSEALQATSLVGHKVLVNTDKVVLDNDTSAGAAVEIPPKEMGMLTDLKASIYSESGELIQTIDLGNPKEGMHRFEWNGVDAKGQRMPAGNYSIKVNATYQGKEIPLPCMTEAKINSVQISPYKGVILNVAGLGDLPLNAVQQILN